MENHEFILNEDTKLTDVTVFINFPQGCINMSEKRHLSLKSGNTHITPQQHTSYQDPTNLTGPAAIPRPEGYVPTAKDLAQAEAAEAFIDAFKLAYLQYKIALVGTESL